VTELIVQSAEATNAATAYLDYGGSGLRGGEPYWIAPSGRAMWQRIEARYEEAPGYDAPEDGLTGGLDFLSRFRSELASGTFVFVISDFLGVVPPQSAWLTAAARRWETVPVIVQDPLWEQSFPLVGPIVLPLADPREEQVLEVRLTRREARDRRAANERRRDALLAAFLALGLDPVLVGTSDPSEVDRTFLDWAEQRRDLRARR
jgi:hypothetical protein